MKNKFEIHNDVVKVFDCKEDYFFIDKDQLNKIQAHTWRVSRSRVDKKWREQIMVEATTRVSGKVKILRLHRFLMNCPNGMEVDHINHDQRNR